MCEIAMRSNVVCGALTIGSLAEIEKWAKKAGAKIQRAELRSQFRCNGSDAYMSWLDDVLQIRDSSATDLDGLDYSLEAMRTADELHEKILGLNAERNKARTVAGYCWEWKSKKNRNASDIEIGTTFRKQWNLTDHGGGWIIHPDSADQIGCIHTCQGLEVDYIGVIIGPDLIVRNGVVQTDPSKRAKADQSLKGRLKLSPEIAKIRCDRIIRNTYRTLMTRGSKGCLVFSTDPETQDYFRSAIDLTKQRPALPKSGSH